MIISQQNDGLSLPYLRLTLGVLALITAMYFSMAFVSQGVTGAAFIGALSFVIITEIAKALFSGDVSYFLAIKQPDKAFFAMFIVAVLFALSIMASVWFLVSNPMKDEVQLNNATQTTTQLEQALNAKKTALAACNPSYVTKCLTPLNNDINTLQTQYNNAMGNQSKLSDIAASKEFWRMASNALGTTPENLKMGLALIRSVLLELLGLVLIGQFSGNKRLQGLSMRSDNALREDKITVATDSPQIPVNQDVKSLAH